MTSAIDTKALAFVAAALAGIGGVVKLLVAMGALEQDRSNEADDESPRGDTR